MNSRILICGNDPGLLQTREIVLRTAFDRVTIVLGTQGLESELDGTPADLVVLCHSLAKDQQREVIHLLRGRWPDLQILVLTGIFSSSQDWIGGDLSVFDGPRALIDRAKHMTSQ